MSDGSHDPVYDYVSKIVTPIFNKVANEVPKNLLLGGRGRVKRSGIALYSPHNYRLYIDFSRVNFKRLAFKNPTLKSVGDVTHKLINNGHEDLYTNFMGCRLRVKKNIIEIQNCVDHKKTYMIESSEKAEIQILEILRKKDQECLSALKVFIKYFGGSSKFKILKRHSENKIFGTDSVNALPIKEKFHNQIVKKVYNERNVEYSDPVFVVNHLINSGVVELVPSICKSIDSLAFNVNPLRTLKGLIKSLSDVKKYKNLIIKLSNKERKELSFWLFTLDGVS